MRGVRLPALSTPDGFPRPLFADDEARHLERAKEQDDEASNKVLDSSAECIACASRAYTLVFAFRPEQAIGLGRKQLLTQEERLSEKGDKGRIYTWCAVFA